MGSKTVIVRAISNVQFIDIILKSRYKLFKNNHLDYIKYGATLLEMTKTMHLLDIHHHHYYQFVIKFNELDFINIRLN